MKKIFTIILSVLMLTLSCAQANAQKKDRTNDYNLQKAYEVLREERDGDKALDLVNKQLQDTPDNVDALLLRIRLLYEKKDYARSLRDIGHALRVNKPKKSGVPMSAIYWMKGYVYQDMQDWSNAADALGKAYDLAQKDNPEKLQEISFDYAHALFYADDMDGAGVIYNRMLERDEADQAAMVGLARNNIRRGEYREAVDLMQKCIRYDAGYSDPYRLLMQAYGRLGETAKAVDAGLDWYERCDDYEADSLIVLMAKKPVYSEAAIKDRRKSGDDPLRWDLLLCSFYENTDRYADAVRCYDALEETHGYYPYFHLYRSDCYRRLGLLDLAIADISQAMEREADYYCYLYRGDYYRLSGRLDEAIADYTAAIEEKPRDGYSYYRRGFAYEEKGDRKQAMENYDTAIELDEDYPYTYLMRGELRLLEGDETGAEEDFRQIIRRDTLVSDNSCRMYALHFLGMDDEAEQWMDRIIQSHPEFGGNYYDQACLYARMGRLEESVASLRTAFEKGFRSFAHIELDDDMDPIRELPEFKALVEEFKENHAAYVEGLDLTAPKESEGTVSEVAMVRKPGGTFEVPCRINGLDLQMVFDTGASDVTISSVEANFMLKNGYLSEKDIKGKKYYQIANGDLSEGTVITLREVQLGDAVLHNVDASVVKSQKAPLLLGQSAMERFGTITIDNINNKLFIKH